MEYVATKVKVFAMTLLKRSTISGCQQIKVMDLHYLPLVFSWVGVFPRTHEMLFIILGW
jgi:hypothetical protein